MERSWFNFYFHPEPLSVSGVYSRLSGEKCLKLERTWFWGPDWHRFCYLCHVGLLFLDLLLTDVCVCVLFSAGGEECRLWCALPQHETWPAGNQGTRWVCPREVRFVCICEYLCGRWCKWWDLGGKSAVLYYVRGYKDCAKLEEILENTKKHSDLISQYNKVFRFILFQSPVCRSCQVCLCFDLWPHYCASFEVPVSQALRSEHCM